MQLVVWRGVCGGGTVAEVRGVVAGELPCRPHAAAGDGGAMAHPDPLQLRACRWELSVVFVCVCEGGTAHDAALAANGRGEHPLCAVAHLWVLASAIGCEQRGMVSEGE